MHWFDCECVCLIITDKPIDRFASNFIWGTGTGQQSGNVFARFFFNSALSTLNFQKKFCFKQSWVPNLGLV